MKIIFLDFDGVLNSKAWWDSLDPDQRVRAWDLDDHFDRAAVQRLNRIVEATGAVIVISSSWRLIHGMEELRGFLERAGLRAEILGKTPSGDGPRGLEIAEWLSYRDPQPTFVILDDASDMEHLKYRLVRTSYDTGLLDGHVKTAIEMLNEPSIAVPA